jgi:2-dehydro-3-deoxyphosphogluconate aldolase/(4S)-4-hydroxy-2-oxoglutarate aldolase
VRVGPSERIAATRERILTDGVILCVRLGADATLVELCGAALRGGLRVLELTLTTPGALDAMARLARDARTLVGGGTVLCVEDVGRVEEAGGRFVFSPVFDADVFDAARARGLLPVPGAATPAEILAAYRHGARLVKVFPAAALGGPAYLRAARTSRSTSRRAPERWAWAPKSSTTASRSRVSRRRHGACGRPSTPRALATRRSSPR